MGLDHFSSSVLFHYHPSPASAHSPLPTSTPCLGPRCRASPSQMCYPCHFSPLPPPSSSPQPPTLSRRSLPCQLFAKCNFLTSPTDPCTHLVQALVAVPVILWREADAGAVAAALVVSGTEGGGTLVRQGGKQSACTWSRAWVPSFQKWE